MSMRQTAEALARRLQDAGHTAYFAGGCVRDELLGVKPKDYDIATSATPAEVQKLFPRSQSVGAHFGVILVKEDGDPFEIATFRTDGSYRDGRRPETVEFSTPEEDAQRRDFTVNGMFLDPVTDKIIDFVGGLEDLRERRLRAIGEPSARFKEDHLRLLRAVRFATVLGYEIDPATWSAVLEHVESITRISIERSREEFVRILQHPNRLRGFDLLAESRLLFYLLPEMEALKGCTQPPEYHPEGDVWVHTRLMLSLLPETASVPLVLSVLLHDIGKPATWSYDPAEGRIRFNGHDQLGAQMTEEILRRLKFSNDVIHATVEAVANHMKFMHVQDMRTSRLKRWIASPTFPDELQLHRVDCLGSNGMLDNFEFMLHKQEEFSNEPVLPPRLIDGHALMDLGYPGGPELGRILNAAHDAQLEGVITTREEAIAWVRDHFPQESPHE
ncbi:MAG TPA: CCA tRNA nucleotidyltransferase [Verrucomicrobiales bacterium]|jgi:poly(A) polymerase|nr:CCA tRNA nucleotidyltransferase [Verrucomicrobiales bacterium]